MLSLIGLALCSTSLTRSSNGCEAAEHHLGTIGCHDGQGIDVVYRPTSDLTVAECVDLIEFLIAWKAMHMEQTA